MVQIAVEYSSGRIKSRTYTNSRWNSWSSATPISEGGTGATTQQYALQNIMTTVNRTTPAYVFTMDSNGYAGSGYSSIDQLKTALAYGSAANCAHTTGNASSGSAALITSGAVYNTFACTWVSNFFTINTTNVSSVEGVCCIKLPFLNMGSSSLYFIKAKFNRKSTMTSANQYELASVSKSPSMTQSIIISGGTGSLSGNASITSGGKIIFRGNTSADALYIQGLIYLPN